MQVYVGSPLLHAGVGSALCVWAKPQTKNMFAKGFCRSRPGSLLGFLAQWFLGRHVVDMSMSIIFMLRVGDLQYDTSISSKLGNLKREFTKSL